VHVDVSADYGGVGRVGEGSAWADGTGDITPGQNRGGYPGSGPHGFIAETTEVGVEKTLNEGGVDRGVEVEVDRVSSGDREGKEGEEV